VQIYFRIASPYNDYLSCLLLGEGLVECKTQEHSSLRHCLVEEDFHGGQSIITKSGTFRSCDLQTFVLLDPGQVGWRNIGLYVNLDRSSDRTYGQADHSSTFPYAVLDGHFEVLNMTSDG
jgi:hypothetical protein